MERRRKQRPVKYSKLLKEFFPMARISELGAHWIPRRFIDEVAFRPKRDQGCFARRERERRPGMRP